MTTEERVETLERKLKKVKRQLLLSEIAIIVLSVAAVAPSFGWTAPITELGELWKLLRPTHS